MMPCHILHTILHWDLNPQNFQITKHFASPIFTAYTLLLKRYTSITLWHHSIDIDKIRFVSISLNSFVLVCLLQSIKFDFTWYYCVWYCDVIEIRRKLMKRLQYTVKFIIIRKTGFWTKIFRMESASILKSLCTHKA